MVPDSSFPEYSGPLGPDYSSLPPVEVDCFDWTRGPGSYTECDLVRICEALPPVELEFVSLPDVFLELTFTLAPGADAGRVFANVVKLFERVDQYEKSLGGSGVWWESERLHAHNGTWHL